MTTQTTKRYQVKISIDGKNYKVNRYGVIFYEQPKGERFGSFPTPEERELVERELYNLGYRKNWQLGRWEKGRA